MDALLKNGTLWNKEWINGIGKHTTLAHCWRDLHGKSDNFVNTCCLITAEMIRWKQYPNETFEWTEGKDMTFADILNENDFFQIYISDGFNEHAITIWDGQIIQSHYDRYTIDSAPVTPEFECAIDNIKKSNRMKIITQMPKSNKDFVDNSAPYNLHNMQVRYLCKKPVRKRQKLKDGNVWILHAVYKSESNEISKMKYYFSSKENCEEHLANLVSDMLEETSPEQKIPVATRSCLNDIRKVVTESDTKSSQVTTLLENSFIVPELIDVPLLQYRIPPPSITFDFDQVVGSLAEFAQEIESYEAQLEDVNQEVSDNEMRKSVEESLKGLLNIKNYITWLTKVHLDEEIGLLDVNGAITRAKNFLQLLPHV